MNPVVTRLYAVLVALTLVGLAAWAGADWYQLQQKAQSYTQTVLRDAAGQVAENSVRRGPPALGPVFGSLKAADARWKTIVLWADRGTEYYLGPRPPVPADQAVPRWEPRSMSEIRVDLPVFRAGDVPLTLEAIYEFYGPSEFLSLLKACGVTLLVLLVLTSVMVVLSSRPWRGAETEPRRPEPSPAPRPNPAPVHAAPVHHDPIPAPLTEELPLDAATEYSPTLFAPSGLGWESFLATRLDRELERTASQNQELTLLLFGFKGEPGDAHAWAQAVRETFPSADLDFEYGAGAAVVLPGHVLEASLKTARTFVETVETRGLGTVHAGAAARSGRLISAGTLLAEAASALRRSLGGTVRVLGLKADPDRYREHLASVSA
jgi:hypothetical protein